MVQVETAQATRTPQWHVTNALATTRAAFLAPAESDPASFYSTGLPLEAEFVLQGLTRNKCRQGSLATLHYLARNAPEQFPILMLVSTSTKPSQPRELRNRWPYHSYFAALDQDGLWHFGTPANHRVGDQPSPLEHTDQAESLTDMLRGIQHKEGGSWPNPYFASHALAEQYIEPIITDETDTAPASFTVFHLMCQGGVQTAYMEAFPADVMYGPQVSCALPQPGRATPGDQSPDRLQPTNPVA